MKPSDLESDELLTRIAVVGMSVRLPGANTVDEFWANILNGVESITRFTKEELEKALRRKFPQSLVPAVGLVQGVHEFDHSFFSISAKEALTIDPQQRLFLEVCWEALERAGYDPKRYPGSIGVYAGSAPSTYIDILKSDSNVTQDFSDWQLQITNNQDFLSTRVSYKLGLTGPSFTILSGCSTSLVSVCQAVNSLIAGNCDMALAGGVAVHYLPKFGYATEGSVFSADGRCRAFDASASGTVASNGVGVVLLKRLKDAVEDGDHIHCVIAGQAVNNDGSKKIGFTAPSVTGQAEAIQMAYDVSQIDPATIGYIEAHGTGTPLGDPIEIEALCQVFEGVEKQSCYIGSVKSNLGHTDAAAGVIGLIKAALALEHRVIPRTLHFEKPNAEIDFKSTPFKVSSESRPWERAQVIRRAAVSSLGIGGTNAHVILEEAPERNVAHSQRRFHLFPISANSREALANHESSMASYLEQHSGLDLNDVALTLQLGRAELKERDYVVASDVQGLVEALRWKAQSAQKRPGEKWPDEKSSDHPEKKELFLMFPGQGGQYPGIGRDLYQTEPLFKEACDQCISEFERLGLKIKPIILASECGESFEEAERLLKSMAYAQAVIFTIEFSIAKLLLSYLHEKPKSLIAHSLGMYAAACVAEVFSVQDACRIIAKRASLFDKAPEGAMVAVSLSEQELRSELTSGLSISVINSSSQCVVSGLTRDVELFEQKLREGGIDVRRLQISAAAHSHLMTPFVEEYRVFLDSISKCAPKIALYSDLTSMPITAQQATSSTYWANHLSHAVNFSGILSEIVNAKNGIFVETGPGRTLTTLLKQCKTYQNQATLSSLPHAKDEVCDHQVLFQCLGAMWKYGFGVRWNALQNSQPGYRTPLSTYPFERKKFVVGDFDVSLFYGSNKEPQANAAAPVIPVERPVARSAESFGNDMDLAEITQVVCQLYGQHLGMDHVLPHHNFFDLGGDSLISVRILKEIRSRFAITISTKAIFKAPTPHELSQFIQLELGRRPNL